jgi:E3 ubiquitin-protein ligase Mdm2
MTGNEPTNLRTFLADPKQSLLEINRSILNSFYTFKLGAPLKNYILKKKPPLRESYTLAEILTILKIIIRDGEMFDMRNPAIILCNKELEQALNMRAMHVTEIRELVYSQLMRLPDKYQQALQQASLQQQKLLPNPSLLTNEPSTQSQHIKHQLSIASQPPTQPTNTHISLTSRLCAPIQSEMPIQSISVNTADTLPPATVSGPTTSVSNLNLNAITPPASESLNQTIYANKNARFELKQDFRVVLSTLPTFNINQKLFTYEEVTRFLSTYILSKKDCFFDPRNIKLALVKDDPLGKAFKVDSFHRCQVTSLLRKQLIYVDTLSQTSHNSQPPNTMMQVPTGLFRIIHASPPAGVSAVIASYRIIPCKRSCPDNEQPIKQFRPLSALMLELPKSSESEADSHKAEEKNQAEEESDSEEENVYDNEYEMDSTEELKDRPPQAGGGNNKSSDEDSEIECQKTPIHVEESDGESINWADNEDNMTIVKIKNPIENKFIASTSWVAPAHSTPSPPCLGYQKCLGCKDIKTKGRYCESCWQMKKDWLPDPPKPHKRTKRTSRRQRNEQRDKRTEFNTLHCSNKTADNSKDNSSPITTKPPMMTSLCMFCCTNTRNASLIHGQLGHQLCCYPCAKKLWKEQARCPVCRRKIEKIVKLIQT